ncbi:MAG: 16S rRNA (uracil(1498)-N(3))-methyltransferase [Rickettsiales bacterium]|jgi:16S rRNA (uracil1498-N3)-methyltransferase|nr:16S rRNA (uracil(1498)-N(3))-methyltransferase [Rickettsiales bacterium]
MRNQPRLFINGDLHAGASGPLDALQLHYLTRVMRTDKFLAFGGGLEFFASVRGGDFVIGDSTGRADPSGKWTFCFAPIKRVEDLVSFITQMGVGVLQPVITERTEARNVNWGRMRKIMIEAAEQSGRSSIPALRLPMSFTDLPKSGLIYGDERAPVDPWRGVLSFRSFPGPLRFLIGPEGGFSPSEFESLDSGDATGVSLGSTILRAEVAAIALCSKFL